MDELKVTITHKELTDIVDELLEILIRGGENQEEVRVGPLTQLRARLKNRL